MAKSQDVYGDNFDVTVETDSSVGSLTAGIHRARCKEATVGPNKAKDGHNLVLTMESLEKGQEGRTARTWLSLKESARWKLTEALQAFGVEPEADKSGAPKVRMSRATFLGKKVRIQIELEDYQGEDRPSIERILPWDSKSPAGGPPKAKPAPATSPLEEDEPEDVDDDDDEDTDDVALPDDEAVAEEELPF